MKKAGKILLITLAALTVVGTGAAIAKHYHDAGAFTYPWDNATLVGKTVGYDKLDWSKVAYDRNYTFYSKDDTAKTVVLNYINDTEEICKIPETVAVGSAQYTVKGAKGFYDNQHTKAVYLPNNSIFALADGAQNDSELLNRDGDQPLLNMMTPTNGIEFISIGEGITEIPNHFAACFSDLKTVQIRSEELTSIGSAAFYHCDSLESVDLPDTITTILGNSFAYTGLKSVKMPSGVVEVADSAFLGCKSLVKVELSQQVTRIGSYSFGCCQKLSEINLPDSLTTISAGAFYGDVSLKDVTVPSTVKTICDSTFYDIGGFLRIKAEKPIVENGSKEDLPVFFDAYKANVTWNTLATERTKTDKKVYYKGMWKLVNGVPTVIADAEAAVASTSASALN